MQVVPRDSRSPSTYVVLDFASHLDFIFHTIGVENFIPLFFDVCSLSSEIEASTLFPDERRVSPSISEKV